MPKVLEEKLRRLAERKGFTGERKDRYVYGTMAKLSKKGIINWKPGKKK